MKEYDWRFDVKLSPSRLLSMTQEHGRVEPASGQLDFSKYPLGTQLMLIPYHVSNVWIGAQTILYQFYCHPSLVWTSLLISAVLCNRSDASRVPCALRGASAGEVDTHSWVVNSCLAFQHINKGKKDLLEQLVTSILVDVCGCRVIISSVSAPFGAKDTYEKE